MPKGLQGAKAKMLQHKNMVLMLTVCVTALMIVGCGGGPEPVKPEPAGPPQWVNDPYGAFPGDRGKVMYAVGVSMSSLNEQLDRRRSESDGRVKLAETMKVKVDSMLKDWMATSTDYVKPENTTSKQFTEAVSRQVTSTVLVGSTPYKYVRHDTKMYVLMRLALDDYFFKQVQEKTQKALQQMERDQQEKVLKGRMEDAMKSLDSYLDKEQAGS